MKQRRWSYMCCLLAVAAAMSACAPGSTDSNAVGQQVAQGLAAYQAGKIEEAGEVWKKAARAGNRDAQYYLGVLANEAREPDYPAAVTWFEQAAAQGHAKAKYNLALAYERGMGTQRDHAKAIALLKESAAGGDLDASYMLGLLMLNEAGAPDSPAHKAALAELTKAAEGGNPRAQFLLGSQYADGSFGRVDPVLARKWLRKAIESGVIEALRPYVELEQSDAQESTTAIDDLVAKANGGDARAQHELAGRLIAGDGTERNLSDGVEWLRKSAEQGYANAEYDLGISMGSGNDPDPATAKVWLMRAADKNHARAQYAIGQLYAEGSGVDKDEAQAVAWYRKAAAAGLPIAEYAMGYMYSEGSGLQRDDTQAMDWFRKAANHGHAEAAFRISTMYANGEGVGKDPGEQTRWQCRAAVLGSERAMAGVTRRGGIDAACAGLEQDLSKFAISVLGRDRTAVPAALPAG